jgi:hypothetical protein
MGKLGHYRPILQKSCRNASWAAKPRMTFSSICATGWLKSTASNLRPTARPESQRGAFWPFLAISDARVSTVGGWRNIRLLSDDDIIPREVADARFDTR